MRTSSSLTKKGRWYKGGAMEKCNEEQEKPLYFMFFFLFIVYVHILWLMLCTWQCLNMYLWFALSLVLLCPCCILYPWCDNFSVLASVKCWTCKWYFALSLLACMSKCSFIVWMIIMVTIYSDCSCGQAMLYCYIHYCLIALCLLHMHFKISAYNELLVLLFLGKLVCMVQELHEI